MGTRAGYGYSGTGTGLHHETREEEAERKKQNAIDLAKREADNKAKAAAAKLAHPPPQRCLI